MAQVILDGGSPDLITFNVSLATAVTLDWASQQNFSKTFQNIGSANITLTPDTPSGYSGPLYKINGLSSFIVPPGARYVVTYINSQWTAYVSSTSVPLLPETFTPVTNEWVTGYNSSTGTFSGSQPAFSNVSGNLTSGQLPTSGISVTVVLAQLTSLGSPGSLTVVNGLITNYVAPS
jgi:hypothetical protein